MGVDVNLNGPFYMIYYFAPRMIEAGEGRVMNISSGVSQSPEFGRASYMTTKAALEAMTRALAHDLSGKVAVNCIQLEVPVWTEGFAATLPEDTPIPVRGRGHHVRRGAVVRQAAPRLHRQGDDHRGAAGDGGGATGHAGEARS